MRISEYLISNITFEKGGLKRLVQLTTKMKAYYTTDRDAKILVLPVLQYILHGTRQTETTSCQILICVDNYQRTW
jgi:hypothetical protein